MLGRSTRSRPDGKIPAVARRPNRRITGSNLVVEGITGRFLRLLRLSMRGGSVAFRWIKGERDKELSTTVSICIARSTQLAATSIGARG